ncbi:MAG: hypothetical protein JO271_19410 [Verrucomicrobia bacterium]|nr:hypothetical protein [Verrucomicrobiota bacterium]
MPCSRRGTPNADTRKAKRHHANTPAGRHAAELVVMSTTEDYPGPTHRHPEKEDREADERPGNLEPTKPPLPPDHVPPSEEEEQKVRKKQKR